MKHRIGFIGYGNMGGGYHYEVAKDRDDVCDDLKPVAVYDMRESQRELAVERGLTAYDNLEDFLAHDDMDIVVVACGNNFHCEMTCKALEAGKHVICEKPVSMNPAEFDVMVETAKRCGKHFFVHQNRRLDRDFLMVKKAYEEGRLGKIVDIESNFQGGYMAGWRLLEDHAGGILYDWGVHLIDQIVYLFNEPVKSVYANLRLDWTSEVDDRSVIEFTFESGVHARVTVCGSHLADCNRFNVYGTDGALKVENIYDDSSILREFNKKPYTAKVMAYGENGAYEREITKYDIDINKVMYPDDGTKYEQDWAKLYKNMLDTIDGNDEMIVKYDQVKTVLQIIDAAFESSKTGRVIEL